VRDAAAGESAEALRRTREGSLLVMVTVKFDVRGATILWSPASSNPRPSLPMSKLRDVNPGAVTLNVILD
jgi:hypothetical protein